MATPRDWKRLLYQEYTPVRRASTLDLDVSGSASEPVADLKSSSDGELGETEHSNDCAGLINGF